MHATVCDTITDLVQNAVEAGAKRTVLLVATGPERIEVRVADNGKGMDAATLRKASDPFYTEPGKHSRRKVGLGIPLLLQTCEACGGKAEISSEPGKGTTVAFWLDARNVDTPPLGDVPETALGLMTFAGDYDLVLERKTPKDGYTVSRKELEEALGDLAEAQSLSLARDFLRNQEANLEK